MKEKSLKKNAILNSLGTVIGILFPIITFPYISRILLPEGIGQVNFVSSIISYFSLLAGLGISKYGIREAAKVRENINDFSLLVKELGIISFVSTFISYVLFFIVIFFVPKFHSYKNILFICSLNIPLATLGFSWVYSALENFTFSTIISLVFQSLNVISLFLFVKSKEDILIYVTIPVLCSIGSVGNGKVINRELSVIEAKKNLFTPKGFLGFPFLKIINSQKIQGLRFDPSITYCEDTDFFYRLFSKCNKILWTDKPLYNYENNPNSVTRGIGFTSQVLSKFNTIQKLYYTEKNRIIRHSILCYNILAHYRACYLHIMYKRDSFDENYKNAIYFCRKNFFKFLFDIRYSWNIKIFLFYICFFKRPEKTLLIKYLINKYQRLNIIH